ncbi:MAG: extracellular solute-binding protein, partial [Chloroflexota bacterium]|nr:extracellular solute-binding protein [Chloroflexota bacterium]
MTPFRIAPRRLAGIPLLAAVAFVATVVMIACSGESPTATVIPTATAKPTATVGPTPTARIVEVAVSPGKLILYVGRGESLVGPIIEEFADLTGIDVEVKYGGTAELASTLLEEGGRSPADVFFAQDPGGLGAVEDMFAPLPASLLDRVPEWTRSPDGRWVGISGRARTLVYNSASLSESDLPDDVWGLTEPRWKGRIGWAPTNASF